MAPRRIKFLQADVFSATIFGGNPLAVFPRASRLSTEEMQRIALEMNYSETAFVLPPSNKHREAHYRVRFFTPTHEIPFAGHPTLGVAYLMADMGRIALQSPVTRVYQECGDGIVPVELRLRDGEVDTVYMHQGVPRFQGTVDDTHAVADALSLPVSEVMETGLPMEVVSTGLPVMLVPVKSLSAMMDIGLKVNTLKDLCRIFGVKGLMTFTTVTVTPEATVHTRMFAPLLGIQEDPATGSASGALGAYLVKHGIAATKPTAHILCEQGYALNRPSTIFVEVDHAQDAITDVRVGGKVIKVLEGTLML